MTQEITCIIYVASILVKDKVFKNNVWKMFVIYVAINGR